MINTKYRREATRFATYLNAGNDGGPLRKEFREFLQSSLTTNDSQTRTLRTRSARKSGVSSATTF